MLTDAVRNKLDHLSLVFSFVTLTELALKFEAFSTKNRKLTSSYLSVCPHVTICVMLNDVL
jgi:hypothetical protein